MKVHFLAPHRTGCNNDDIIIDWDYPFIPQIGDSIHLEAFIGDNAIHEDSYGLSWDVWGIEWHKIDGETCPTIYLDNEFSGKN